MKQVSISIHPFSALVGMAVLSMVWVSAAAMPLQGSSSDRDVSAIEDVNDPRPRDFVRLIGETPYTVPDGKLLVVTGLGSSTGTSGVLLSVDGVQEATSSYTFSDSGSPIPASTAASVASLPGLGFVANSGSTVLVSKTSGRAWGYLVDA